MKKYTAALLLIALCYGCFAQNNRVLIRHDTTVLKATEGEWMTGSLVKNNQLRDTIDNKSIAGLLLDAVEKGRVIAIDPQTEKPIPPKEIYTWNMPRDSIMQMDESGNNPKIVVRINQIYSSSIVQLNLYQDLYIDISSGKMSSVLRSVDLVTPVITSQGYVMGNRVFCRIVY